MTRDEGMDAIWTAMRVYMAAVSEPMDALVESGVELPTPVFRALLAAEEPRRELHAALEAILVRAVAATEGRR